MGKHKHEANGKKEQLKWTENMDNFFIQAMIVQQENGNRVNGNFTTHAYNNMVAELRTKLQMDFTKNHLKNRLKTLKEHFSQWYDMFHGTSLNGFTWNSSTQLIEAEEEVWDKLIESKPDAAAWKTKKVSNFNKMLELFSKDRATGAHAVTAKERNAQLQKNDNTNVDTNLDMEDFLAANDVTLESQYNIDDDIQLVDCTEQSSSEKKIKNRKRKLGQEAEDFTSKLLKSVDDVALAIREGNKILERVYHREYTGDEIYKELEPMGLEPHEMPMAFNYLVENQAKARSLFSCPVHIRLSILKCMMGLSYKAI
ncbi:putative Myb/SANT-like domain-containing protein [Helianthus debilis subsp. tardiflorus]